MTSASQETSILDQVKADPARRGFLPWLMWSLGALFYCYEFFLQVSPNVMVNDLMRAYDLTATQVGNLSAYYYYAYGFIQIPVGIILDRFGTRRPLTIAVLLCAIGTLMFGAAQTYTVAAAGRFMIGTGSAFAALSCLHIAASWLPINRFAMMTGILLTIGMLGAFNGQAPLSYLINIFGWRNTLLYFSIIGFVLSVIIFMIVRDRAVSENTQQKSILPEGFFSGLGHVLRNKQIWVVSCYGGLMFLTIPGFAGLWSVSFISQTHQLDRTHAAFLASMIFLGFAVGAPLFGWFSDRIGRRKPPMYTASIGSLILVLFIMYSEHLAPTAIGTLFFLFGFFCSGFLPVFSVAREINPPEVNATALGFVNTLNTLGGAITQPIIGFMLDQNWQGGMENGARLYSTSDYHVALLILPIAISLSLVALFFVRETYCKSQ